MHPCCLQGEIEKTDEEIATAPESPPKRRRRVKKAEDGAAKPGEPAPKKGKRVRSDEAEDADQPAEKPKKSKKPRKDQPGPEAAPAAALAEGQAAQAPGSSAPAGSALPSLPGVHSCCRRPVLPYLLWHASFHLEPSCADVGRCQAHV